MRHRKRPYGGAGGGYAPVYRRRRRKSRFFSSAAVVLAVLLCGSAFLLLLWKGPSLVAHFSPRPPESMNAVLPPENSGEDSLSESSPDASAPPENTGGSDKSADGGLGGTALPDEAPEASQPEPVDDSYFDDAAFIGNSRTQGLMLYTGLSNATFYTAQGLMVDTFFTKKVIGTGENKVTIPDAMKQKTFGKVYIMLGVNELGWSYENVFIQKYGELIDEVKKLEPDATIFVQSILPVSGAKSDRDKIYNNPKIDRYNELIQQMAADKGVTYLNVAESVGLDDGALPAEASTDGVHLNKEYCFKWLDYLKTHTQP